MIARDVSNVHSSWYKEVNESKIENMDPINCVLCCVGPIIPADCGAGGEHNGDNEVKDNEDHQHLQSAVTAHFFIIWFTHSLPQTRVDNFNW